jgi:hypothetical protein
MRLVGDDAARYRLVIVPRRADRDRATATRPDPGIVPNIRSSGRAWKRRSGSARSADRTGIMSADNGRIRHFDLPPR